jgi:hypothetical protein
VDKFPEMEKRLFDFFTEKFKENLPKTRTMQEAFDKTNKDIGFTAYTDFRSYNVLRSKKKKARR